MIEIQMNQADENAASYGITHKSASVYRNVGSGPLRVKVWDNTNRPNPHPGETRWTNFGSIGGDGQYLDPNNKGTDETVSILISPESTAICADTRMNTGQPMSGQVYSDDRLTDGATVTLVLPNDTNITGTVKIDRYGHGRIVIG
jgi:hypothetical protein